jgi:hypothetical protein
MNASILWKRDDTCRKPVSIQLWWVGLDMRDMAAVFHVNVKHHILGNEIRKVVFCYLSLFVSSLYLEC